MSIRQALAVALGTATLFGLGAAWVATRIDPPAAVSEVVEPELNWDGGILQKGVFGSDARGAEWYAFKGPDGEARNGPGGWYRVDLPIENGHYVGARYASANGQPARIHGTPDPDRKPFITDEDTLDGHPAPEGEAAWSGWFATRDDRGRLTALHLNYREHPVDPVDPGWAVMRVSYEDGGGVKTYFDSAGTVITLPSWRGEDIMQNTDPR